MADLEECEQSLTPGELEAFAGRWRRRPPQALLDHYARFNGGYPTTPVPGLQGFNAMSRGSLPIERLHADLTSDHPWLADLVPFAFDEGGHFYLLSLRDEDFGVIHILLPDPHRLELTRYESFTTFLSQLDG